MQQLHRHKHLEISSGYTSRSDEHSIIGNSCTTTRAPETATCSMFMDNSYLGINDYTGMSNNYESMRDSYSGICNSYTGISTWR